MEQRELINLGAIKELDGILSEFSPKNILLVRGNQSYDKSGAKDSIAHLFQEFRVIEFYDFSINPKLEEAQRGLNLLLENDIDVIIAIGGGSVIDTAKIIKYLAIEESLDNHNIPLIATPTTAGSGSEATHFAVVYINGKKHSYASSSILPSVAIVDANLLRGQSPYQIAVSGADAFAQGIESMWSINSTNKSIDYSEKAIKIIWDNLELAVDGDIDALAKTAAGANWAGKAINTAKTTAAHAMSYGFTSKFDLPHGHAVSLSIPFFINIHQDISEKNCNDLRGAAHVQYIISKIARTIGVPKSYLTKAVYLFYEKIGLLLNFKKLNISHKDFIDIIKHVNKERLLNNPFIVELNTLEKLFSYEANNR